MGVKKSTVWTIARSPERRYTPASSAVSKPTSKLGSATRGRRESTWSKTFGLNLDAQPAAFTWAVSFLADTYNSVAGKERESDRQKTQKRMPRQPGRRPAAGAGQRLSGRAL